MYELRTQVGVAHAGVLRIGNINKRNQLKEIRTVYTARITEVEVLCFVEFSANKQGGEQTDVIVFGRGVVLIYGTIIRK